MKTDEVLTVVEQALGVNDMPEDAEMGKFRGWDSIRQISVVLALEEAADIDVPGDMFGQLISIPAILDFLRDEGVLQD